MAKYLSFLIFLLWFQAVRQCQALFQGSEDSSVYAFSLSDIEIEKFPLGETFFFLNVQICTSCLTKKISLKAA